MQLYEPERHERPRGADWSETRARDAIQRIAQDAHRGFGDGAVGAGYAFLKLYALTRDDVWLERARAFAMHGIDAADRARQRYGQRKYSLWTGDLGLAIYLSDCLDGDARLPTLDVF